MNRIFLFAATMLLAMNVFSQEPEVVREKKIHSLGFQANQLLRQALNTQSNPYLVTWTLSKPKGGFALSAGLGYKYEHVEDKSSTPTRTSDINELSMRVGAGRVFVTGGRIESGLWLDGLFGYTDNNTSSSLSVSRSKGLSYGGGPRLSLGVNIGRYIQIGTEASLYTTMSTQEQSVTIFNFGGSTASGKVKTSNLEFQLPTAIYLFLRF